MSKFFKRRSKKVGSPPGSLIYTGESAKASPKLTLLLFDKDILHEKHPETVQEAFSLIQNEGNMKAWLHIVGIHDPKLIEEIGKNLHLHPLLLEDVMSPTQRSKLDDYKDHIYMATHLLTYQNSGPHAIDDEQLSIVLGENILVSFSEKEPEALLPIKERLERAQSRMREQGVDYIAYAILDCIVDNYFVLLEHFDIDLEALENELLKNPPPETLQKIQKSKRDLSYLRKTVWPMRELVNHFRKIESPLVSNLTKIYSSDVYDHIIQAIETIESFRELTSGMLDIYLSTINQKMNEIMKVLTVLATIFVPLTFITSLYGMNFEYMPELHHPLGYPFALFVMASITLTMLVIFHRKRWI